MMEVQTRLGKGGRIVLPAPYRRRIGLRPGDDLVLVEEEQGLLVLTPRQAVLRARALLRAHLPAGRSLAGELIRERREEARGG